MGFKGFITNKETAFSAQNPISSENVVLFEKPVNVQSSELIKYSKEFVSGGSQIITLPSDFFIVQDVEVDTTTLIEKNEDGTDAQFRVITPNKIEILDPLTGGEYIVVKYWKTAPTVTAGTSLSGKSYMWMGTSIPQTGYPQITGTNLGATVYNEAVGSSMARAFNGVTGTFKGLQYQNCLRSLSQTLAEKQSLMDNWKTGLDADGNITGGTYGWRDLLIGTPPAEYTTVADAATILSWSYEKKIVAKYLNTASPEFVGSPNFFVFDHGHNDLAGSGELYDSNESDAISIPVDPKDRSRFSGAINYLIDIILKYNPRARIIFIGHYENDRKERIYKAQQIVSEYWDFPLIELWKKLGWSQKTVETTGYWNSGTWVNSGGALQTLTQTQIWMQDDIHPSSTEAKSLIANILTEQLKQAF